MTIDEINGFIEEKNDNKYLAFDYTDDENKEALTKYAELQHEIKNDIETIIGSKKGEYEKAFMDIKFNSDNNLPLNEILKIHITTIVVRSALVEDGKFHPQIYLDEFLFELQKGYSQKELIFQKELTLIKQVHQKYICIIIIGI